MHQPLSKILTEASRNPIDHNLAYSALLIAKVEYPHLDPKPYLDKLDTLGKNARLYIDKALQKTKDEFKEIYDANACKNIFKQYMKNISTDNMVQLSDRDRGDARKYVKD